MSSSESSDSESDFNTSKESVFSEADLSQERVSERTMQPRQLLLWRMMKVLTVQVSYFFVKTKKYS